MKWTIILIKCDNNDWYINYMQNKLLNQINNLELQKNIEVRVLNDIKEFEIFNYGNYINIIEDCDISDNYVKAIYNKIGINKKDCIIYGEIIYYGDSSNIFNTPLYVSKTNPIRKDILIKNIDFYLKNPDLTSLINSKAVINDIIIFKDYKIPFSIIITAYKTQNFIEECLDSIENQTYFKDNDKFEVLVGVDNCYETLYKLSQIKDKYRNLHIYMMEENKGTYIATNTLIDLVKYENVIRFDSDDIMKESLVKELTNYLEYDVIRLGYNNFKKIEEIESNLYIAHGVMYFKKKVTDELAGGFQAWWCAADTEFIKRIKNKAKILELKESLFYRRMHDGNLTMNSNTGFGSDVRKKYAQSIKHNYNDNEVMIERIVNKYKKII